MMVLPMICARSCQVLYIKTLGIFLFLLVNSGQPVVINVKLEREVESESEVLGPVVAPHYPQVRLLYVIHYL